MTNQDTYEADCGHEVPKDDLVHNYEITLCRQCYRPFDLDEWPEQIGKHTHRVIEGGMGLGSRTTHHVNRVFLIGLDDRGRARYYDEENCRVKTYVPMNDRAYREDRIKRAAKMSGWRASHEHLSVLTAERHSITEPEPAPAYPGDFVTLPNGDHIVMVDATERITNPGSLHDFGDWLEHHQDEFKVIRESVANRHNVDPEPQFNDEK